MQDLTAVHREVDANLEAFQKLLPELMEREADRWALMRHGKCVDFYDTFRDAMTAGNVQFKDGAFSIQEVTETVVDLGWYSRAVL